MKSIYIDFVHTQIQNYLILLEKDKTLINENRVSLIHGHFHIEVYNLFNIYLLLILHLYISQLCRFHYQKE